MNISAINNKRLPDYVFNKRFEKFAYAIFSETNHNQIKEFMQILCSLLKDTKSEKLFSFEIKESKLIPIKEFDLTSIDPDEIASFFKNFKEENGIPYFLFIALNLVFVDENETICVYADRELDVSIIGCSKRAYDKLKERQGGLHFMTLNEYLTYIKQWIKKETFSEIEEKLIRNYS